MLQTGSCRLHHTLNEDFTYFDQYRTPRWRSIHALEIIRRCLCIKVIRLTYIIYDPIIFNTGFTS